MPLAWPDKDPDDILDYSFTIVGFDASDTIVSSVASVIGPSTLAIAAHGVVADTKSSTTRLTGGVDKETGIILIRTTMASGQRVDATVVIKIAER